MLSIAESNSPVTIHSKYTLTNLASSAEKNFTDLFIGLSGAQPISLRMDSTTRSALFQPIQIGPYTLQHRIVLAPLTRLRCTKDNLPQKVMAEYYSQRGSIPGTLLVSEATLIAQKAGQYLHAPGIWSDAQMEGWKKVSFCLVVYDAELNIIINYRLPKQSTRKGHSSSCNCGLSDMLLMIHLLPLLVSRSLVVPLTLGRSPRTRFRNTFNFIPPPRPTQYTNLVLMG